MRSFRRAYAARGERPGEQDHTHEGFVGSDPRHLDSRINFNPPQQSKNRSHIFSK